MPKGPRGEKRPADVIGAARGCGKPAQAVALTRDPDSPVIFHLRRGDSLAPKVIEHEPAPEALGVPLVAISVQDDAE